MYNQLLISAGGGIIARDQQAEQSEAATIAIGLGGTGISCLRALKKEVYTRLKPDDETSTVPTYKHVKFLAVDTDKSSLGDDGSLDALDSATEFLDLSCADISAMLAGAAVLKSDPSLQWLKAKVLQPDGVGIEIQSAEAGAGGVRQIGRLLLLQNCNAFVTKLTNILTSARKDLPKGAEINVHIFTGLGGGTGAGTFLDVCYLVQHVLESLGIYGAAQTCGYFFMPDVNIDRVSDAKVQTYIKSNGFASMKELDHCMNFAINGGKWEQQYDGFKVETVNPPVKLAHLITATNQDGALVRDAYHYAMRVAVDYVMDFLVKPVVSVTATENPFTIKSHVSNIRNIVNVTPKKHGAAYEYCVLGASNAYLPYREINTYLASKIFEGFRGLREQLPTEGDLDKFVITCALKYEDIIRALNDRVPPIPTHAVDYKMLYEQVDGISAEVIPQILSDKLNSLARISGKFTENKKALLDTEPASVLLEGTAQKIASLYARVKSELLRIAGQPEKGPFYAGGMLHNLNSRDLLNVLRGYQDQNSRNLGQAQANLTLRVTTMETALSALQNSNIVNRKGRAADYVGAVHNYLQERVKINLYEVMGDVLADFIDSMDKLYGSFFGVFGEVVGELQSTFDYNLSTLSNMETEENDYAVKLITIQELRNSLDGTVAAMRIPDLMSDFITSMLRNSDAWIARDENKICHAVSEYFLGVLQANTQKTIVDYLQGKFASNDPVILRRRICDEIFLPLSDRAAPLFWVDGS